MAYITVTTLADLIDPIDGKISLREAVAQANAGDIIRFALNLEGGPPLVLTQGELAITRDLTIDGDRNDDGGAVTIEGSAKSRVLNITGENIDLTLRDLTIANGRPEYGTAGGILFRSTGHLMLTGSTVRGNDGSNGEGGGIKMEGYGSRLTVVDSAIVDNVDSYGGGGIICRRRRDARDQASASFRE